MKTGDGYIVQALDGCSNCKYVGRIPWNDVLFCRLHDAEEIHFNPPVDRNGICDEWAIAEKEK